MKPFNDEELNKGFQLDTSLLNPEQIEHVEANTIAECGEKTLIDNPTIADHIGSHMNLAFEYAKELVNENTRLEQENAELKERIAELEAQLAQNAELKEPVYNKEWLHNCVNHYNCGYFITHSIKDGMLISVYSGGISCPTLSPKDSAPIIINALAKYTNSLYKERDWIAIWQEASCDNEEDNGTRFSYASKDTRTNAHVFNSPESAQKALDILLNFPTVKRNYLL